MQTPTTFNNQKHLKGQVKIYNYTTIEIIKFMSNVPHILSSYTQQNDKCQTKTEHNSSPWHYVSGEQKKTKEWKKQKKNNKKTAEYQECQTHFLLS